MSKIPVPPKRNYKNRSLGIEQSQEMSPLNSISPISRSSSTSQAVVGSGFNVPRALVQDRTLEKYSDERDSGLISSEAFPLPKKLDKSNSKLLKKFQTLISNNNRQDEEEYRKALTEAELSLIEEFEESPLFDDMIINNPDVVIGEDVEIKGDFQFEGLLYLLGRFEGELITNGDVYVGPQAVLKSNLTSVRRLLVDGGHVNGDINISAVSIRGKSVINGDVNCQYFEVKGEDISFLGQLFVADADAKGDNFLASEGFDKNGSPKREKESQGSPSQVELARKARQEAKQKRKLAKQRLLDPNFVQEVPVPVIESKNAGLINQVQTNSTSPDSNAKEFKEPLHIEIATESTQIPPIAVNSVPVVIEPIAISGSQDKDSKPEVVAVVDTTHPTESPREHHSKHATDEKEHHRHHSSHSPRKPAKDGASRHASIDFSESSDPNNVLAVGESSSSKEHHHHRRSSKHDFQEHSESNSPREGDSTPRSKESRKKSIEKEHKHRRKSMANKDDAAEEGHEGGEESSPRENSSDGHRKSSSRSAKKKPRDSSVSDEDSISSPRGGDSSPREKDKDGHKKSSKSKHKSKDGQSDDDTVSSATQDGSNSVGGGSGGGAASPREKDRDGHKSKSSGSAKKKEKENEKEGKASEPGVKSSAPEEEVPKSESVAESALLDATVDSITDISSKPGSPRKEIAAAETAIETAVAAEQSPSPSTEENNNDNKDNKQPVDESTSSPLKGSGEGEASFSV